MEDTKYNSIIQDIVSKIMSNNDARETMLNGLTTCCDYTRCSKDGCPYDVDDECLIRTLRDYKENIDYEDDVSMEDYEAIYNAFLQTVYSTQNYKKLDI